VLASQLPHQQVVLVTPRLAAHAFLPFDLLKGTLNERPPRPVQRGGRVAVGDGCGLRRSANFPTRFPTQLLTMGKDGIDLLIAIKKRPNLRTQRDCKIQDEIAGNSLGNRRPFAQEVPEGLFALFDCFCHAFKTDGRALYWRRPTGTINLPPPGLREVPSLLHDERIVGRVKYYTHD
jgi:hypothetical protein